ncbi:flagellar biosynthetic protein FliO [Rhodopirellula sp. P2]|uniref:flagellar biosynthetic protein FliO n=1 Tax=Rhodopirellula sp. P2 TaxID=2127060 RepID=UPI002367AF5B|nr:flagellar biosynthetic protein FliO [Rhodopirellula sp. P2]WDQ17934.1 flagellar biosynthetic protein FliO [Rhodopirellula sp. P2]
MMNRIISPANVIPLALITCLGAGEIAAADQSYGSDTAYGAEATYSAAPLPAHSDSPEPPKVIGRGFPALAMQTDNQDASAYQLPSESKTSGLELSPDGESSRSKNIAPLVTVGSSLAIVLALFCGLVWVSRRFGGGSAVSKPLSASTLSPLGHVMLDPRTKLLLVKCGRRVLVLSQTSSGVTPISEVTDPDEVRELIASCSAEARAVFEQTMRQIESEPVASGFVERPAASTPPSRPRRLFASA